MKRSRVALSVFFTAFNLLSGFGLAQQENKANEPTVKQLTIPAVTMTYQDQGEGDVVIFVHGAFADHRLWQLQRESVANDYRFIAVDLRHYGTRPWPVDDAAYVEANRLESVLGTFSYDLAALIRHLDVGQVHLVGHSSGGNVVLDFAVQYPEYVRSLVLSEPALNTILSEPEDIEALAAASGGFDPIWEASQSGDQKKAVRLFAEWVNGQPGSFDNLPQWLRTVFLDNSRTIPLSLTKPFDPPLSCDQIGRIQVPVTVIKGQQTKPNSAILAEVAHRCIPGSQLVEIPNARHLAPVENPSAFNKALLNHLAGRGSGTETTNWSEGLPPNGVWQVDLTLEEVLEQRFLPYTALDWVGTYSWTFQDGEAAIKLERGTEQIWSCGFTYAVVEDFVRFTSTEDCAGETDDIKWRLDEEGLHLQLLAIINAPYFENKAVYEAEPWQKVN